MFGKVIRDCFYTIGREIRNIFKWTYQKLLHGICDAELWNFNDYLLHKIYIYSKNSALKASLKIYFDDENNFLADDIKEVQSLLREDKVELLRILRRIKFDKKLLMFIKMNRHGYPAEFAKNEDWEKELSLIYYDYLDGKVNRLIERVFTLWD